MTMHDIATMIERIDGLDAIAKPLGYLGGHLTFVRGVGVNHTFMEDPLPDLTAASTTDALSEGNPMLVDLDDVPTLLYRSNAASIPQPAYDVQVTGDKIMVRPR